MTTWWWVRHGPTYEKAFVGWRDVPADLTDQAAISRLAAHLPGDAVVVSSDLIRSITTADAIAGPRTRLPHAPEIKEFNFGDWDGLSFDEVAKRDPEISRQFWDNPGDLAPPNGESWHDVAGRVAPLVARMNARFAGRNIVAVAHIGVIMTQIAVAGAMTPAKAIGHKIDTLSVTRLEWGGGQWRIGAINHNP